MKQSLLVAALLLCSLASCNKQQTDNDSKDPCSCCPKCNYETYQTKGSCDCCDSCEYKKGC